MKRTGFRRPTRAELTRKLRERDRRRRIKIAECRHSGKQHVVRVGETPRLPGNWRALCVAVLLRDDFTCRRCGRSVVKDGLRVVHQIDHVIPRQLGGNNAPWNLVTLCARCHGLKSSRLEPALYRGDVLMFRRFLAQIGEPGPPEDAIEAALDRLMASRRFMDSAASMGGGGKVPTREKSCPRRAGRGSARAAELT